MPSTKRGCHAWSIMCPPFSGSKYGASLAKSAGISITSSSLPRWAWRTRRRAGVAMGPTSCTRQTPFPPLPILLAGTLAASCGFALPVATPPNAIAYATGAVTARQMARAGLFLDVVAVAVMIAAVLLLGPIAFPR